MIKIISILLVLISIVFLSSTAWADLSVKDYKKVKEIELIQEYINGVGRGLGIGNAMMRIETGKRLFCVPENFALEKPNLIRILDDEIERREKSVGFEKAQQDNIEILLLFGLKITFPCE